MRRHPERDREIARRLVVAEASRLLAALELRGNERERLADGQWAGRVIANSTYAEASARRRVFGRTFAAVTSRSVSDSAPCFAMRSSAATTSERAR